MRELHFKKFITLFFCYCACSSAFAQDIIDVIQPLSEIDLKKIDERYHYKHDGWRRIIPTHSKVQYAGGIGFISVGGGWDYGKKCCWETDLMIGFIPKTYSDKFRYTFTLKQNYIPWSISCSKRFVIEPFTCGLYLNTISGEEFWKTEPDRYPGNAYYSFSTKVRTHIYIGQRFIFNISEQLTLKNIALFYELSANDFDIVAKFGNKSLQLKDIISLSIGLKFQIIK